MHLGRHSEQVTCNRYADYPRRNGDDGSSHSSAAVFTEAAARQNGMRHGVPLVYTQSHMGVVRDPFTTIRRSPLNPKTKNIPGTRTGSARTRRGSGEIVRVDSGRRTRRDDRLRERLPVPVRHVSSWKTTSLHPRENNRDPDGSAPVNFHLLFVVVPVSQEIQNCNSVGKHHTYKLGFTEQAFPEHSPRGADLMGAVPLRSIRFYRSLTAGPKSKSAPLRIPRIHDSRIGGTLRGELWPARELFDRFTRLSGVIVRYGGKFRAHDVR